MKKQLLAIFATVFTTFTLSAQDFIWYDLSTSTFNTPFLTKQATVTVTLGGINTFTTTNKFESETTINSWMSYRLLNPISGTDLGTTIVKIILYFRRV